MNRLLTLTLTLLIIAGCRTTRTSTLVSDSYDNIKDETTLMIFPYGNIVIPGEWKKYNYNQISRQYFFINSDSIAISVTKNPIASYPFYSSELSTLELTHKWYQWESDYYSEQGIEIQEVNGGSEDEFIIWQATATKANNLILYGIKNNIAFNFSVLRGDWNHERRIEFLKNLWETN